MSVVRDTMIHLIRRERDLISDPGEAVFREDQIQDALDQRRTQVIYAALQPAPSFTAGGVIYLDYYSALTGWEDDVLLQDLSFTDVTSTATVFEPIVGHWAFATQPPGLGIRVTGKVYDVYAAAADLLETWAGRLKLNFGFSTDAQRFGLSEQVTNILTVARQYRLQAQPRSIRIVQSDTAPDVDGGGIVYPNLDPSWGGW